MSDEPHNSTTVDHPATHNVFDAALEEADGLAARLDGELAKGLGFEASFSLLSSFIYGCGQKLIDRAQREQRNRPLDESVIRACSRIFTDCLGGYLLLRRGLVLPAVTVLRAVLETTMQTIMFMEQPTKAPQWLAGKQFRPSSVRNTSPTAAALYQSMYGRLSDLAHPNVVAALLHTVPLPRHASEALLYGGWFAPRTVGTMGCEFVRLELAFLRAFYSHYEADLASLGLLFRQPTTVNLEELGYDSAQPPISWKQFLDVFEHIIDATEQHFATLPPDDVSWAAESESMIVRRLRRAD